MSCNSANIHSLTFSIFFFFNDTATTEIYTLSLHDALPICPASDSAAMNTLLSPRCTKRGPAAYAAIAAVVTDRKSTRLNSSHGYISYAVFCLKKKNTTSRSHSENRSTRRAHKPCGAVHSLI